MHNVSMTPLRDATYTVAQDIIERGLETEWNEDELSERLQKYIRKGIWKVTEATSNGTRPDEAIVSYVQSVLQSMGSALGHKDWYQREDWGPLLAAGIEELTPRPRWMKGSQNLDRIRNKIYDQCDKTTHEQDFSTLLWNLTKRFVDNGGLSKVYSFLDRAYKKTEKDFKDPSMKSSQKTDKEFVKLWTQDALWRIWQSGVADVPATMPMELCFNCIKLELLPQNVVKTFKARDGRDDWMVGKAVNRFLKDMVLDLYVEGHKNSGTGEDLPGEREEPQRNKKREREEDVKHESKNNNNVRGGNDRNERETGRGVLKRRSDSMEEGHKRNNIRGGARSGRGEPAAASAKPARVELARNARGESGRRPNVRGKSSGGRSGGRSSALFEPHDRRSSRASEIDLDDVSIEEEFTRGTRDGEDEFLEEDEEAVREAMDLLIGQEEGEEEVADEDQKTWVAEDEEEPVLEEEPQGPPKKKARKDKLECVAVQAESCSSVANGEASPVLIREKLSGWIYCELCWNALLVQQEEAGGDCEFDGEYVGEDEL